MTKHNQSAAGSVVFAACRMQSLFEATQWIQEWLQQYVLSYLWVHWFLKHAKCRRFIRNWNIQWAILLLLFDLLWD